MRSLLLSALFSALCILPSWLWTGTLTPQITSATRYSTVATPRIGPDSYQFLPFVDSDVISIGCNTTQQPNGTFTSCPGIAYSGSLIDSIRTASTRDGATRNHTRFDNSGYAYANRSYGVGASAGLIQTNDTESIVESYHFLEVGYESSAKCTFNESSAFSLRGPRTNFSHGLPNTFVAQGRRPNQYSSDSNETFYAQVSFGSKPNAIVALSAGSCCGYRNGTGPFFLSIAAGAQDRFLDNVQCEIFFTPKTLNVTASVANRTLAVTPLDVVPDPEPRGQLREWSLRALQTISMVQTTQYVSVLGMAFANNVMSKIGDTRFNSAAAYNATALPAIEDSVVATLDDVLAAINGYSLTQPGGYDDRPATLRISVAQIGTEHYQLVLFAINIVTLIIIAAVSVWTRLFAVSPAFDFADLASMIAGVSNGGIGLDHGLHTSHLMNWGGHAKDPWLSGTALQLDCKPGDTKAPIVTIQRERKAELERE